MEAVTKSEPAAADTKVRIRKCCSRFRPNPALIPLKLFYFLQLGGIASLFLYISLFMDQVLGLSKSEIAVTSFLAPLLSFFSRLVFGGIADRSQKFRLVLLIVVIGNCVSFDLLIVIPPPYRPTPATTQLSVSSASNASLRLCLSSIEASNTTCLPPWPPHLADCSPSACLPRSLRTSQLLTTHDDNNNNTCLTLPLLDPVPDNCTSSSSGFTLSCAPPHDFLCPASVTPWSGVFFQALLFRTLGYMLFSPCLCLADTVTMALLEPEKRKQYGGTRLFGTVGFFVFALVTSAALRATPGSLLPTFLIYTSQALLSVVAVVAMRVPEGLRCSDSMSQSFRLLCLSPETQVFFLFALLGGLNMAVVENYVFIAVKNILKPSDAFFGLMTACMVISETPVMAASGYIIARIGELNCITLGFLFWALRFFLYSIMAYHWQVLLTELLHGLTFALVFPSLVTYGSRLAPVGTEGTMQGMVSGVHLGLGVAVGGLLGGVLLEWVGYSHFFLLCCFYSIACAVALFLLRWRCLKDRPVERSQEYVVAMTSEAAERPQENGHALSNDEEDVQNAAI